MRGPAKEYELTFEERTGYFYAHVRSAFNDPKLLIDEFSEIIPRCREIGATKLLVDVDVGNKVSMTEAFDAAVGVVGLDTAGIKIAYVDKDPEHFDSNQFGELVGVNRGANAKVFISVEEGEEWLLA